MKILNFKENKLVIHDFSFNGHQLIFVFKRQLSCKLIFVHMRSIG